MKKLYILLRENKLPNRYACAFALASMDSLGDVRNDVYVTFTSSMIYNKIFLVSHNTEDRMYYLL